MVNQAGHRHKSSKSGLMATLPSRYIIADIQMRHLEINMQKETFFNAESSLLLKKPTLRN